MVKVLVSGKFPLSSVSITAIFIRPFKFNLLAIQPPPSALGADDTAFSVYDERIAITELSWAGEFETALTFHIELLVSLIYP